MAESTAVVIIGAGGFGREVLDVVLAAAAAGAPLRFAGFVDDGEPDRSLLGRRGAELIGGIDVLAGRDVRYLIGIGDSAVRRKVAERCDALGLRAASVVHPAAVIGGDTSWEEGFIACGNSTLTTNIRLGRHVHVNINATIGHDCRVGDFVTIYPGANISGNVTINDDAMIGTGAAIIQGRTVGHAATVGAGAVVTRDIAPSAVAVGVPARAIARPG